MSRVRGFVLLPGAGGHPRLWRRLTPLLHAAGHLVTAVALPNQPGATLADQVDVSTAAVDRLVAAGATEVVVVAQSMAGFLAPPLGFHPSVGRLVLLNAMIPRPAETAGEWWDATGQPAARRAADCAAGRDPDDVFDPAVYFLADATPEVRDELMTGPADEPPAESLFSSRLSWPEWPAVDTTVLVGSDDCFFPPEFQRRVSLDRLGMEPVFVPGGHLAALTRAPEVAVALQDCAWR